MSYRDYENDPRHAQIASFFAGLGLRGHPRFYQLLATMALTHAAKNSDYTGLKAPLHNLRSSEEFGLPGIVGTWVRTHDKVARIDTFVEKLTRAYYAGKPVEEMQVKDEAITETAIDLSVYAALVAIMGEEYFAEAAARAEAATEWKQEYERRNAPHLEPECCSAPCDSCDEPCGGDACDECSGPDEETADLLRGCCSTVDDVPLTLEEVKKTLESLRERTVPLKECQTAGVTGRDGPHTVYIHCDCPTLADAREVERLVLEEMQRALHPFLSAKPEGIIGEDLVTAEK